MKSLYSSLNKRDRYAAVKVRNSDEAALAISVNLSVAMMRQFVRGAINYSIVGRWECSASVVPAGENIRV